MSRLLLIVLLSSFISGCGIPSYLVSEEQREADIEWIFAVFDRNYAPKDWKKQNLGVDLDVVKQDCLAKNKLVTSNDQFRELVHQCVATVQDAHTSALQSGAMTPGKGQVAYLGFRTTRVRKIEYTEGGEGEDPIEKIVDALEVKEMLPSTKEDRMLVKVGDLIIAINGKPVDQVLLEEIVPYNNLGQEQASLTAAGRVWPVRSTIGGTPLPTAKSVDLTISRFDQTPFTVSIPWTRRDLYKYMFEQSYFKNKEKNGDVDNEDEPPVHEDNLNLALKSNSFFNPFGKHLRFDDFIEMFLENPLNIMQLTYQNVIRSFRVYRADMVQMISEIQADSPWEKTIFKERALPAHGDLIENATFPAMKFPVRVDNNNGGQDILWLGYVRIPSFSLVDSDLEAFKGIVAKLTRSGVKGIVVDLLDNGGGSLVHGMALANMLSPETLKMPTLEVSLNDAWYDSFKLMMEEGATDQEKTLAKEVVEQMDEQRNLGKRLSRPIDATVLAHAKLNVPKGNCGQLNGGIDDYRCVPKDIKVVLLVNEMCASMCDIFASIFKDNQLGPIIGSQTMGAGGNVVMHAGSPVSGFLVSQTESLVLDAQGNYLENQGVLPTETTDTVMDRGLLYEQTLLKGAQQIIPNIISILD